MVKAQDISICGSWTDCLTFTSICDLLDQYHHPNKRDPRKRYCLSMCWLTVLQAWPTGPIHEPSRYNRPHHAILPVRPSGQQLQCLYGNRIFNKIYCIRLVNFLRASHSWFRWTLVDNSELSIVCEGGIRQEKNISFLISYLLCRKLPFVHIMLEFFEYFSETKSVSIIQAF